MTISREEIRRVRELAETGSYPVKVNPEKIIALCDAAERGAEVTADMVVAAVYAYEANSGEISTLHDMRVALEAALAHAGSGKT